jgi:hypothetical protein
MNIPTTPIGFAVEAYRAADADRIGDLLMEALLAHPHVATVEIDGDMPTGVLHVSLVTDETDDCECAERETEAEIERRFPGLVLPNHEPRPLVMPGDPDDGARRRR